MDPGHYQQLVAATVKGRRWIAAFEILSGLGQFAERLARQDSEGLFIIAGIGGGGDPPGPGLAQWRILGIQAPSIMKGIRAYEEALLDLPASVVAAIDEFDPDQSALVLRNVFAVDHPVAGRRSYGARPRAWADLENKMTVDALWDAAGVDRAPSDIVPASPDRLTEAASRLDRGSGTVWAGDNKEGWHGGASHVRWVRSDHDAVEAAGFLGQHCDRARVMPFLDGTPCSIHGMVIGDEVITFRPVELVMLRRPESSRLFYAGASTAWDPPDQDRDYMRDAARRVGAHLRDALGYRGAFNLDGVLSVEGWLPTELNARFSAGLGVMQQGFEAPLIGIQWAVVEGEDLDYRPPDLERLVLEAADRDRIAGAGAPLTVPCDQAREADIVLEEGEWRFAAAGEDRHGMLALSPSPTGSYLRLRIEPGQHPIGESVASKAVAAFALADAEWGSGIGEVEAAPEVR